ncbi:MAG: hypothetical protein M3007_01920, partial [Candidatus Eremiobacteraeota bacterium]|nr:hypothetical protein [Candidatus Eremiobacteraeota bacterium]
MNRSSDVSFLEQALDLVSTVQFNDVEVVHVCFPAAPGRWLDADRCKLLIVKLRDGTSAIVPGTQVRELCQQNGRLNR